ncbi:MAG TPA: putative toxin-antitoxin system toxin component, PIN family [Verrucomicrobiae bacterium]|nr:putative toxin-antitoxin system toxin component, PIN family [Verrucomicrobiae bacterium]
MKFGQSALRVKLVVDTNVLVSGTLWDGPSARLLEAMEVGRFKLVISAELLGEYAEVIAREKFARRISALRITERALVLHLARHAEIISGATVPPPPDLRDPKDMIVLAAAGGSVDAIVTGDDDLLCLKLFRGIPIVKVQDALQLLGISSQQI